MCACAPGRSGADCSLHGVAWAALCPNECSSREGHGHCDREARKCQCADGWTGDGCQIGSDCASGCHGEGTCVMPNRTCVCNHGFTGDTCERRLVCPDAIGAYLAPYLKVWNSIQ